MTAVGASFIGAFMLFMASIPAMAALSHCPRHIRVWPVLLMMSTALVLSDRGSMLMDVQAPLVGVRSWLTVVALGAAAGTMSALSWTIAALCHRCRPTRHLPRGIV